ncbi:hypothetical protein M8C21_011893, partial [Ambrosia artemisiifolia]
LPITPNSESHEDADYNKICEKHKHLIETLPKGKGWRVQHLYNYNGFWLNPKTVKNNLVLHKYFKAQPTDIVLAAFMKSGTTWLKALMFSTLNRHRYSFSDHPLHHNEYGPFWEHIMSYWRVSLESPDKILFLKYEELKRQPEVVVRKLAAFMGKPFTADEEKRGVVGDIVKLCSFENLSNLEVNTKGVEKFGTLLEVEKRDFFRKGKIGDWKNYLSDEMKERIDRITHEKLQGSGLILTTVV